MGKKNKFKTGLLYAIGCILFFSAFGLIYADDIFDDRLNLTASYIEKFTRFIEWPEKSSVNELESDFIIGVYRDRDCSDTFAEIFRNQTIKGKDISVVNCRNLDDIKRCNLLYIPDMDDKTLEDLISTFKSFPLLTISQSKGFAEKGIHINLYYYSNKLKFEINDQAVRDAGFKVSYLLLLQAKIIKN